MQNYLLTLLTLCLLACSGSKQSESDKISQDGGVKFAVAPAAWIDDRVADAQDRLTSSPAGQKIWASIEAHGGLRQWFANGPVSFHFDYQPLDGGARRDSYQVVDQWSVRTVHEVAANRQLKYGWDGSNAWSFPDTADVGVNPRFWSNTPYYFVGLPFVLADDGVVLEELEPYTYKGVTYDMVKATYEDGTGDAPDDFYVIYINPETRLMGGLRYIVSYPGFYPDGGNSPEKFMEILGMQISDGISIPSGYNTYWFKENEAAEHITKIDVTEFRFWPETEDSFFNAPEGAKIQEGL